jgi:hypothetical protein
MKDFFDWFFGLFVAQPLTEFVTGLPVLRVFRIESSFNSPREFARIRVHICFLVLTHVASSELKGLLQADVAYQYVEWLSLHFFQRFNGRSKRDHFGTSHALLVD